MVPQPSMLPQPPPSSSIVASYRCCHYTYSTKIDLFPTLTTACSPRSHVANRSHYQRCSCCLRPPPLTATLNLKNVATISNQPIRQIGDSYI
ncbi:hypothetical protein B296_00053223 [Ensete ventricosum]|uniref:Uncharacterized protein n=1 Tax=Ensete ventricosum TaxID=4639 RepID=A0A426XP39_ENSVE|nr:hypothetical protein B296_00053223 [Ensete ventricosum]